MDLQENDLLAIDTKQGIFFEIDYFFLKKIKNKTKNIKIKTIFKWV